MKKSGLKIAAIFFLIICLPTPFVEQIWAAEEQDEFEIGTYCTVYDEEDPSKIIFVTGRYVALGDQYQTADDRLYEVVSLEGDNKALARFVEEIAFEDLRADFVATLDNLPKPKLPGKKNQITVGLYHTHSDESYTPTDGKSSIRGNGGIYHVGKKMAATLKEEGIKVVHDHTKHDPHDVAAYKRSRRTAQELLQQTTAVLDVHRDAVPREQYAGHVKGEKIAQVQLVVGRQNPNMAANKQFAQEVKAVADKEHPGLVKGIFFARSGYNQDLSPRNLLVEVGTHLQSREEAEKGASLFAKSFASYLQASAPGSAEGQKREGATASKTGLWLVGFVALGAIAFLFLSTGSLDEMGSKLRKFSTREFADVIKGPRRSPKDDEED